MIYYGHRVRETSPEEKRGRKTSQTRKGSNMKSISINNATRSIELTKTFTKAASKFGSPEYLELQAARRDYPDFRVVTVAQKAAKPEFKGLTYEYMKAYIRRRFVCQKRQVPSASGFPKQ